MNTLDGLMSIIRVSPRRYGDAVVFFAAGKQFVAVEMDESIIIGAIVEAKEDVVESESIISGLTVRFRGGYSEGVLNFEHLFVQPKDVLALDIVKKVEGSARSDIYEEFTKVLDCRLKDEFESQGEYFLHKGVHYKVETSMARFDVEVCISSEPYKASIESLGCIDVMHQDTSSHTEIINYSEFSYSIEAPADRIVKIIRSFWK